MMKSPGLEKANKFSGKSFRIFLIGCISISIGLLSTHWTVKRPQKILKQKNEVTLPNNTRFQIGYGSLPLDFYKRLELHTTDTASPETFLVNFPVFENDISERIRTNRPALNPDYSKLVDRDWKEFISGYKKLKSKVGQLSVTCLILKQSGKLAANNVVLDAQRVELSGAIELYDDTDLTNLIELEVYKKHKRSQITMNLGPMDTGEGVIIPLCICNYFMDPEGGGWRVTDGVVYVPTTVRYQDRNTGKEVQVPIKEMLAYPIFIN